MTTVDLNSDLGESFGRYTIGRDKDVIGLVSSVNIACGMHAGDPIVLRNTVRAAAEAGIGIGAHPGYPDLQGFGRRDMALSPDEAYCYVLYQIGAADAFCKAQSVRLNHVKPHGQLYNTAAKDPKLSQAIAQAVYDYNPDLVLFGLAGGCLIDAGTKLGLRCAQEFFADRNYTADGTLVPRSLPHAIITDEDFAAKRVVRAVKEGRIVCETGQTIPICADTICLHGDNEKTLAFARLINQTLQEEGIEIRHP